MSASDAAETIVQAGKYLNYFIILAATLSLTVIVLKLRGEQKFELGHIEFRLDQFIYVAIAITVAHAFLTWIFLQQIDLVEGLGKEAKEKAWNSLTHSSGVFLFFGMKARLLDATAWPHLNLYVARSNDTAFWFTAALSVAVVAAYFLSSGPIHKPESWSESITYVDRFFVGLGIATINWIIGAQWAIAISRFAN